MPIRICRAVIIALLDTACRLGEILWLQWKDVNLERRELTIQAVKAKTRTSRILPISVPATLYAGDAQDRSRRKRACAGCVRVRQRAGERISFGSRGLGRRAVEGRARTISRSAISGTRPARGSIEAGVSTNYVSKILGHTSLNTTTRYLNIQRRGLHLAMEKLEESQRMAEEQRRKKAEEQKRKNAESVAQTLHTASDTAPAVVSGQVDSPTRKRFPS